MTCVFQAMWQDESGVLSFEWTLLVTILVIGVVAGISGARDAIIDEFGDVAQAIVSLDDSYTISYPLHILVDLDSLGVSPGPKGTNDGGSNSGFIDRAIYQDCTRLGASSQQLVTEDVDS